MKRIMKYALLVVKDNKILLQQEEKIDKLLLPGGKPNKGEDYLKCLRREIKEEINAEIIEETLRQLGKFEDIAADGTSILTVELYLGELKTKPKPSSEVKRLVWFGLKSDFNKLSPIIRNKVMPYLQAVRLIK
jgi:8-oxo-dGTP diphosphatase